MYERLAADTSEKEIYKKSGATRDYAFDNIRFLLIFSVVFAHLLENAVPFQDSWLIYKVIYSFHMPAFIFLFGYFSKYSPKRILYGWVIPYFVCQSLYIFFANCVLQNDLQLQYTTPYWLLWYMLACIFYQLLIPFYTVKHKSGQVLVLCISLIIALLAGFDSSIGYYMSLSRFFVFQPWFILGLYCRQNSVLEKLSKRDYKHLLIIIVSTVFVCLSIIYLYQERLPDQLLYGSYNYSSINCTIWMRIITILMALSWICFLFVGMKPFLNRQLFCITGIGQNTLPVFLLHGFIVKAAPIYFPELLSSPLRVLLLSFAILLLLGNRFCKKITEYVCLCWLEKWGY